MEDRGRQTEEIDSGDKDWERDRHRLRIMSLETENGRETETG